jgi:hypothetical protein
MVQQTQQKPEAYRDIDAVTLGSPAVLGPRIRDMPSLPCDRFGFHDIVRKRRISKSLLSTAAYGGQQLFSLGWGQEDCTDGDLSNSVALCPTTTLFLLHNPRRHSCFETSFT